MLSQLPRAINKALCLNGSGWKGRICFPLHKLSLYWKLPLIKQVFFVNDVFLKQHFSARFSKLFNLCWNSQIRVVNLHQFYDFLKSISLFSTCGAKQICQIDVKCKLLCTAHAKGVHARDFIDRLFVILFSLKIYSYFIEG